MLAWAAVQPVLSGARKRLKDRAAQEALSLYVDGVALLAALITIAYKPLGFALALPLLWLVIGTRRRKGAKYAGLRILR